MSLCAVDSESYTWNRCEEGNLQFPKGYNFKGLIISGACVWVKDF